MPRPTPLSKEQNFYKYIIYIPVPEGTFFPNRCNTCTLFLLYCLVCSLQTCGHLVAGKGLTFWLSCVWCVSCVFVTFQYGVLCQVWYLILSILDLCLLPYFAFLITLFLGGVGWEGLESFILVAWINDIGHLERNRPFYIISILKICKYYTSFVPSIIFLLPQIFMSGL